MGNTVLTKPMIYNRYALFAQDDWRLTRELTVNLGLRWEYVPRPRRRTMCWPLSIRLRPPDSCKRQVAALSSAIRKTSFIRGWDSPGT